MKCKEILLFVLLGFVGSADACLPRRVLGQVSPVVAVETVIVADAMAVVPGPAAAAAPAGQPDRDHRDNDGSDDSGSSADVSGGSSDEEDDAIHYCFECLLRVLTVNDRGAALQLLRVKGMGDCACCPIEAKYEWWLILLRDIAQTRNRAAYENYCALVHGLITRQEPSLSSKGLKAVKIRPISKISLSDDFEVVQIMTWYEYKK